MNTLNDRDKWVLRMVARHYSIREMADSLGVGLGTIELILRKLTEGGFIKSPPIRQARMRKLTRKGTDVLHREGLLK